MPNEVQHLLPNVSPTLLEDGACELTFDGQTTASIPHGDINTTSTFASAIQAALEALSNIGSGNVSVAWSTDRAVVTFQGSLANTNVPELTVSANTLKAKADTVSATTTTNGAAPVAAANEVQRIFVGGDVPATTGSFKLNGNSTFAVIDGANYGAGGATAAAEVQAACDAIWGSGKTSVTNVNVYENDVEFIGDLAETDIAEMTVSDNTTDASPGFAVFTQVEGTPADAGQPQIVTVTLPDSPDEGTLNVTLDATTSADFNYNDSSPASITGWTGGGSAGNWTYTSDTSAANVSASGAEGSTPLRKSVATIEITVVTEGGAPDPESPLQNVARSQFTLDTLSLGF